MKRYNVVIVLLCMAGLVFSEQSTGKVQFGVFGSVTKLVGGEQDDSMASPWFGLNAGYTINPKYGINVDLAFGWDRSFDDSKSGLGKYVLVKPGSPFRTYLYPVTVNMKYNLLPDKAINPYFIGGFGILFWDLRNISNNDSVIPITPKGEKISGMQKNALLNIGAGSEFFVGENFAFDFSLRYQQLFAQNKDMSGFGDVQTGNIEARFGLNFYFGGWKDTDNDGIEDKLDECPGVPEDFDGFQDEDGCPDYDNDGDGIADALDKAPNDPEDLDGFQDNDGIPDPDNDNDGILDKNDKCPLKAEDKDGFQDEDGCPDPDNDKDGIPDNLDKCPNEAETVNGFEDNDGCPDKKPEVMIETKAPIILKGVTFKSGSAELSDNAKVVLDAVYRTLVDYPEMSVQVRGHTDNTGSRDLNIRLSGMRAESVKSYLVFKGIGTERIETVGFGPDKPIATNSTEEGRALNRRIEFIRIQN